MSSNSEAVRLDKWLWAARFYKTRSIARNMVDGGKVHYNGQRTKPSKIVELGATITLRQGYEEKRSLSNKLQSNVGERHKRKQCIRKQLKALKNVRKMH